MLTDATGNMVVNEMRYKPYGELITSASTGPDISRLKYTAHESDDESTLIYMRARYYDPKLGRMLTPDSIVPRDGGNMTTTVDSTDLLRKSIQKSHEASSFIDDQMASSRGTPSNTEIATTISNFKDNLTKRIQSQSAFSFLGMIALSSANPLDLIVNQSRDYTDLSEDKMTSQSLNRFLYAKGNPLRYTDPDGHSFWNTLVKGVSDFFKSSIRKFIAGAAAIVAGIALLPVISIFVMSSLVALLFGIAIPFVAGVGLGLTAGLVGAVIALVDSVRENKSSSEALSNIGKGFTKAFLKGFVIGSVTAGIGLIVVAAIFAPQFLPFTIGVTAGVGLIGAAIWTEADKL